MLSVEYEGNKLLRLGIVICWHFRGSCDLIPGGEGEITGGGRDDIDLGGGRGNYPRCNK